MGSRQELNYEYDLVVVGGGPGGVAAAKEAAKLGKKVALCDISEPSTMGTTWGHTGTCVTVGFINHNNVRQARMCTELVKRRRLSSQSHSRDVHLSWASMADKLSRQVDSLNQRCVEQLKQTVSYFNGATEFIDPHTVKVHTACAASKILTAKYFILATGTQPKCLQIGVSEDIPAGSCVSSDDLMSLPYAPVKALVVGDSYSSLEWTAFLCTLGSVVTLTVDHMIFPGLDRDVCDECIKFLEEDGLRYLQPCTVRKARKLEEGFPGTVRVTVDHGGLEFTEDFSTVVVPALQGPYTEDLHLEKAGIGMRNGKIRTDHERTDVAHIFAIGERFLEGNCAYVAPVCIDAGVLLARRLFTNDQVFCDYSNMPPSVFMALDYGCFGYSEQEAEKKFGRDKVNVYQARFSSLKWADHCSKASSCLAKLVCVSPQNRIIGFHYIGPDTADVVQGFAQEVKLNPMKKYISSVTHANPICAEIVTNLKERKRTPSKDVI
ncbi:thioredoxin reductase 1, cytoplasmic-like isoform X2 [Ornithodoros turicata]